MDCEPLITSVGLAWAIYTTIALGLVVVVGSLIAGCINLIRDRIRYGRM